MMGGKVAKNNHIFSLPFSHVEQVESGCMHDVEEMFYFGTMERKEIQIMHYSDDGVDDDDDQPPHQTNHLSILTTPYLSTFVAAYISSR